MDPGATDAAGNTCLILAVGQEDSFEQEPFWDEFFDRFCASKPHEIPALLNHQGDAGETCLRVAAALEKTSLVCKLLFWGADPSIENQRGQSAHIPTEWMDDVGHNPLLDTVPDPEGRQTARQRAETRPPR